MKGNWNKCRNKLYLNRIMLGCGLILLGIILFSGCYDDEPKPVNSKIVESTHMMPVDLGLSVDWADCNIGSTASYEFGGHYCWGDPTGMEITTIDDAFPTIISGTQYDIVAANFGKGWRLPTLKEVQELLNDCKRTTTSQQGNSGISFKGPSGESIFLPKAGYEYGSGDLFFGENVTGYYWIGELESNEPSYFYFGSKQLLPSMGRGAYRCSVRAVKEKDYNESSSSSAGNNNSGGNTNSSSSSYEKPEVRFYSADPTTTTITLKFKIDNQDKAKVTQAKVMYGETTNLSKSVTADIAGVYITATLKNLKKDTKYFVRCEATGKGGTTTTEITQVCTLVR